MTNKKLKEILSKYSDDLEVIISADNGYIADSPYRFITYKNCIIIDIGGGDEEDCKKTAYARHYGLIHDDFYD